MPALIDILPGQPLPVSEVTRALAHMWDAGASGGEELPGTYRASQMNLILHFGVSTPPEEALRQFEAAIQLAQRYPSRIVVLCPRQTTSAGETVMEGKLYSQCFLGRSLRERCCCEALMLGYHPTDAHFLEDQVSIWLESDLPTYHWFHRVPPDVIENHYLPFTKSCRRVLYDSAVDGYALHRLPWPRPATIRDLAWARILPIRQSLGQFFSGIPPASLAGDLLEICVRCRPEARGEADNLLCWLFGGLNECRQAMTPKPPAFAWTVRPLESDSANVLEIDWHYRSTHRFTWRWAGPRSPGWIEADFGRGNIRIPLSIRSLQPGEVLAEACLF